MVKIKVEDFVVFKKDDEYKEKFPGIYRVTEIRENYINFQKDIGFYPERFEKIDPIGKRVRVLKGSESGPIEEEGTIRGLSLGRRAAAVEFDPPFKGNSCNLIISSNRGYWVLLEDLQLIPEDHQGYSMTEEGFLTNPENWKDGLNLLW